jgi:hypothetical protein
MDRGKTREAFADRIEASSCKTHRPDLQKERPCAQGLFAVPILKAMNVNLVGGDPYGGSCALDQFFIWRPFARTVEQQCNRDRQSASYRRLDPSRAGTWRRLGLSARQEVGRMNEIKTWRRRQIRASAKTGRNRPVQFRALSDEPHHGPLQCRSPAGNDRARADHPEDACLGGAVCNRRPCPLANSRSMRSSNSRLSAVRSNNSHADGLVRRDPDPNDSRVTRIAITNGSRRIRSIVAIDVTHLLADVSRHSAPGTPGLRRNTAKDASQRQKTRLLSVDL